MPEENATERRVAAHPVKDIVLPLGMVAALIGNALLVGTSWGRNSERLDAIDRSQARQTEQLTHVADALQALKDRMHDAERDIEDQKKNLGLLEDYTRGRVDLLPYHAPRTARK